MIKYFCDEEKKYKELEDNLENVSSTQEKDEKEENGKIVLFGWQ